jgi:hypothetical protein
VSPERTNIKPLHSSTPTRKAGPPKCASPLKIVNINFQSIKSKLCRLSNVIDSIKPDIIIDIDLQVRLLTCMSVGRSKLSSCIGEWSSLSFG